MHHVTSVMRGRVAAIRPKVADSFFGHADPEGADSVSLNISLHLLDSLTITDGRAGRLGTTFEGNDVLRVGRSPVLPHDRGSGAPR